MILWKTNQHSVNPIIFKYLERLQTAYIYSYIYRRRDDSVVVGCVSNWLFNIMHSVYNSHQRDEK